MLVLGIAAEKEGIEQLAALNALDIDRVVDFGMTDATFALEKLVQKLFDVADEARAQLVVGRGNHIERQSDSDAADYQPQKHGRPDNMPEMHAGSLDRQDLVIVS